MIIFIIINPFNTKIDFIKYLHKNTRIHSTHDMVNMDFDFSLFKYWNKNNIFGNDLRSNDMIVNFLCDNKLHEIKYLHIKYKLNRSSIIDPYFYGWNYQLYDHTKLIKYLHTAIGFTKTDFELHNNSLCRYACLYGRINMIKYMCEKLNFTKHNFDHGYCQDVNIRDYVFEKFNIILINY